ncbi:MAG: TlpA family protein disulfide reductase [Elusimicrobia bacterium]|nr:TlpA family protein disulfide reductase [Elusimicrobiota bacterium]
MRITILLMSCFFAFSLWAQDGNRAADRGLSRQVQNFEAIDLDGRPITVDFAKLRGHPVLLHFWSFNRVAGGPRVTSDNEGQSQEFWREELPALNELAKRHPEITVIAIQWSANSTFTKRVDLEGVGKELGKVLGARKAKNFTVVHDSPDASVANVYQIPMLGYHPSTLFVNSEGLIAVARLATFRYWNSPVAERLVEELNRSVSEPR